jgi:hypothetical protein
MFKYYSGQIHVSKSWSEILGPESASYWNKRNERQHRGVS